MDETERYPFLDFINEDKSRYPTAASAGYHDPYNLFLIGDSGGFLMNIIPGAKFVNTHLLYEVADFYRKHKVFTNLKVDSVAHRQFRKREEYRREHGFTAPILMMPDGTIQDVHITGSHYNFLNYVRINQLDESSIITGNTNTAKKIVDFPKFLDSQFWTYHVMDFLKRNGMHFLICKTRRGGFSYMMASDSSNELNGNPNKVVIHVANNNRYLVATGGLSDFAINNLNFYEQSTPFVRGLVSLKADDFKLGYKIPSGAEADDSWKSSLLSVSAMNNSDCAIGKDATLVKVEEVSTMEDFDAFMNVTEPAMRTGAFTTGCLHAWGTATSGNMMTFEQNFYNPRAFNFMPFENVWEENGRGEICGFFKPYCWGLQGLYQGKNGVDKDGNSDIEVSLKIAELERIAKKESAKNFAEYINYLGQYANRPSESFSNATENMFSSEELSAHEVRLKTDVTNRFHIDGMVISQGEGKNRKVTFKPNSRILADGGKVYDYIVGVPRRSNEDPHGCVRQWFAPEYEEYTNENGQTFKRIPDKTYSISYDPVGVDKEKKEITNKHSHNSITVWMNPSIRNGFKQKIVAKYYGRPDKLEDADRICLYLAILYNCEGTTTVEVNRGETVSNFRKWGGTKFLAFEPVHLWDVTLKGTYSTSYGYVISGPKLLEGLRLVREMIYEKIGVDALGNPIYNFHQLDYQTILELKKWNSTGNFDRVSELILRAIEWKAMNVSAMEELAKHNHNNGEQERDNKSFLTRDWYA